MHAVQDPVSIYQTTLKVKRILQILEDENLLLVVQMAHEKMRNEGVVPILSDADAVAVLKQYSGMARRS